MIMWCSCEIIKAKIGCWGLGAEKNENSNSIKYNVRDNNNKNSTHIQHTHSQHLSTRTQVPTKNQSTHRNWMG